MKELNSSTDEAKVSPTEYPTTQKEYEFSKEIIGFTYTPEDINQKLFILGLYADWTIDDKIAALDRLINAREADINNIVTLHGNLEN